VLFPSIWDATLRFPRKPNLFIIGAPKCGTTSLAAAIGKSEDVFLPQVKEPHFLTQADIEPKFKRFLPTISTESDYLSLYKGWNKQRYALDASTSYYYSAHARKSLSERAGEIKVIMILREPTARAISHYWNNVREGYEERSIREAFDDELRARPAPWGEKMNYLAMSKYSESVEFFRERFSPTRFLLLFFEDLVRQPMEVSSKVCSFLDIDSAGIEISNANSGGLPRNSAIKLAMGASKSRQWYRAIVPYRFRQFVRNRLLFADGKKEEMGQDLRGAITKYFSGDVSAMSTMRLGKLPREWLRE
jgi:hypothetical protein